MKVSAINIHPVKSTAIRPVPSAYAGPAGLRGDREWMVVDGEGVLVTAREMPALFTIAADTPDTSAQDADLVLNAPGMQQISVPKPSLGDRSVRMFKRPPMQARAADPAADAWLQQALGRPDLHLIWCDDPKRRQLNQEYAQPQDHTAFADSAPVSLASSTSLAQLNEWVAKTAADAGEPQPEPLPIQRFRPNLVIDGIAEAFAEDQWRRIQVGEATFRTPKPIDRCVMTTIDPESLTKGKEPIRTLAKHRRWDGKTWFSIRLIPDVPGTITLGDDVTVLE